MVRIYSLNTIKLRRVMNICSGLGQSLSLIGYSSELYEMDEAYEIYWSYDLPHKYCLIPDTVLLFGGCYVI